MTGYKIIDFYAHKSIEIVGIHSVEAERKAWHESALCTNTFITSCLRCHYIHSLYPCVSAFNICAKYLFHGNKLTDMVDFCDSIYMHVTSRNVVAYTYI